MGKQQETESNLAIAQSDQLPDYLGSLEPAPLPVASHQRYTPRLKIVQAMSEKELKARFGEGSVILDDELIAKEGEPFVAVPVFSFTSWTKLADLKDTNSGIIVEESLDPNSTLAAACRDPNRREERYPNNPNLAYKNRECINFVIRIEATGAVCLLNYASGSHRIGARLFDRLGRVKLASGTPAPIFVNRVSFVSEAVTNKNNQTYHALGFDAAKPAFIVQAAIETHKTLYDEIAKAYKSGSLTSMKPVEKSTD